MTECEHLCQFQDNDDISQALKDSDGRPDTFIVVDGVIQGSCDSEMINDSGHSSLEPSEIMSESNSVI